MSDLHKETFQSFGTGKVLTLNEVPDVTFSEKMLGEGYAIKLTEGKVYAPVDGVMTYVFPRGHAYGIKTENGIDVLIHIGIDTTELKGEGFSPKVREGQKVSRGDLLCEVDLECLERYSKSPITPMVFLSKNKIELLKVNEDVTETTTGIFRFI